jgi:heme/copper-type cytochrome/quinol oxidase subunit 2
MSWAEQSAFAKVLVVLVVCFLLGAGLCGLDIVLMNHGFRDTSQEFGGGPLDGVSLVLMILSAVGIIITVVLWFIVLIVRSFRGEGKDTQRLFEGEDKTEDKNHER